MKNFRLAHPFAILSILAGGILLHSPANAQENGEVTPEQIREAREAAAQAEQQAVPRPGDILRLRALELDAEEARSAPGYDGQKTRTLRNRRINIAASENEPFNPLPLFLGKGDVTSMAFYDRNGDPWPVNSVIYDRNHIAVNGVGCEDKRSDTEAVAPNVLFVRPCQFWVTGTMQVLLDGETKALPFDVRSGSKDPNPTVDSSVTVNVQSATSGPFTVADNGWVRPIARRLQIDPTDHQIRGEHTNAIVLGPGLSTDVSFIDKTGRAWPVEEVAHSPDQVAVNDYCSSGSASGVQTLKIESGTFYLTACRKALTTINVRLKDRPAALALAVRTATRERPNADSTLTIMIPGAYQTEEEKKPSDRIVAAREHDAALDASRASSIPGYSHQSPRQLRSRQLSFSGEGAYRPQAIQTGMGDETAIAFFDEAGTPWKAKRFLFDPTKISVNGQGCRSGSGEGQGATSHIIYVRPCAFWTAATLQVHLVGQRQPVPFDIRAGSNESQPFVDSTVNVTVAGYMTPDFADQENNHWVSASSRTVTIDSAAADRGVTENLSIPPGYATSISFVDAAQQPWPIEEVAYPSGRIALNSECGSGSSGGGIRLFTPDGDRNTVYVSSCSPDITNVTVRLRGRAAPLGFNIRTATPASPNADSTLTVTVPGVSPVKRAVTSTSVLAAADLTSRGFTPDPYLDDFLDGAPLPGSRRVIVSGSPGVSAWLYDGALYVRGAIDVINPAHDAHAATSDGVVHIWKYSPPIRHLLGQDGQGERVVTFDF